MSKTAVLLLASALAACGMLAAAGLVIAAAIQFGLTGAGAEATVMAAYLVCGLFAPGFAAGLVWAANRGRAPRPALTAAILAVGVVLLAVLGAVGWLYARFPGVFRANPWLPIHEALRSLRPEFVVLAVANAWAGRLGIVAGRHLRSPVAARRLTSASLVIALLLGGAWFWRERLFPAYGVWHLLHRFEVARREGDYATAVTLFTPQYLTRELGSPPFAPKYGQACRREQANLNSDDRTNLCFHYGSSPRLHSVAGSNCRRVQLQYHYKNSPYDRLSPVRWTWDVLVIPRGCVWLIADMRLNRERTREFFGEDYEFTQGRAGTVNLLSAPRPPKGRP